MPTTLKIELDKLGFDWEHGKIALQEGRGWEPPGIVREVKKNDPVITQSFQNGAHLDLPRVMASDDTGQYVVYCDPRGSGLRKILKNVKQYIGTRVAIPYPD